MERSWAGVRRGEQILGGEMGGQILGGKVWTRSWWGEGKPLRCSDFKLSGF